MIRFNKGVSLENVAGKVIYLCLSLLTVSVLGLKLIDIDIKNVELVDRGLFTVITEKGPINVAPDDILRIERTYTKSAVTGNPVELDKIYTTEGFIYTSSTDPFSKSAHDMINSVDFFGLKVWQQPNLSLNTIRQYGYAIGTPKELIPFIFFLLSVQYYSLTIGAISLFILIFPLKFYRKENRRHSMCSLEAEYKSDEGKLEVVAK